jgi:hypothetical protein
MNKLTDLLEKHLPKRYYGHEARKHAKELSLEYANNHPDILEYLLSLELDEEFMDYDPIKCLIESHKRIRRDYIKLLNPRAEQITKPIKEYFKSLGCSEEFMDYDMIQEIIESHKRIRENYISLNKNFIDQVETAAKRYCNSFISTEYIKKSDLKKLTLKEIVDEFLDE